MRNREGRGRTGWTFDDNHHMLACSPATTLRTLACAPVLRPHFAGCPRARTARGLEYDAHAHVCAGRSVPLDTTLCPAI